MAEMKVVVGSDALDMATMPDFVAEVSALIAQGQEVTVDMAGVEFIDSTGAGGLVRLHQAAKDRAVRLRFVGVRPEVREVLEIMGIADLILPE